MPKSKPKTYTAEALEAATQEKDEAQARLEQAELSFEQGSRTQETFQRIQAARTERDFHDKVYDLALAEHTAYEQAEAARVSAAADAERVEHLAAIEKDIAANLATSIENGQALVRGLEASWSHAIKSQSLGGSGHNNWGASVQDAIGRALAEAGINPRAIRVT